MSLGLCNQIERRLTREIREQSDYPYRTIRGSLWYRYLKDNKHRSERRRAKRDPECMPLYRRYHGYEW